MRDLSGLAGQHTCRVGGCQEVGLELLACCRWRHGQQSQHESDKTWLKQMLPVADVCSPFL